VLHINPNGKAAEYGRDGIPATPVPTAAADEAVNAAWRDSTAPSMSERFGADNWAVVAEAWQPEHCAAVEALATVVDEVWASVVPATDTQIVIRLVGLPLVVAALVSEVIVWSSLRTSIPLINLRPLAPEPAQTPALVGELMRALGSAVCAGTGQASRCGRIRRELRGIPAQPDEEMLDRLGVTRILAGHSSVASFAELIGAPRGPEKRPVAHASPDASAGTLAQSRAFIAASDEAPTTPLYFGTP
jgi:hypothetical protein